MLFHVTQTHAPESCPIGQGGSNVLTNADAEGVTLRAMYGAFSEHVIYYIVETDSVASLHNFLVPGFERCTSAITPVSDGPISG